MSEFESSTSSSSVPFTTSTSNSTSDFEVSPVDVIEGLNLPYAVCEVLVAICAVVGNALVILVFHRERRLRRRTNYYIISLATADFLVGLLGIPFAVLASVGLPRNLYACLFTVSLLVVLCTISIFCLVAVSVDRYWAILHPMAYSRNVRTKTAIGIIGLCWFSGTFIGFLPLFGWHANREQTQHQRCLFTEVMDYDYLVFLYFATIIFPAMLLAAFYAHIYQVVLKQLRQIVTMNPKSGDSSTGAVSSTRAANGGTMLRVFGAAQKREVKATKNLSIIVFFFIICWIPLYTINCVVAFCPNCHVSLTLTNCCIILSHLNSAGNPLLYAYHLRDFRAALKNLLCGFFGVKDEVTEYHGPRASIGSHVHHHVQSRNNSVQSLRDAHQVKMAGYSDFKVANACLPPLPPLPLELQPRMWTLAEVPSVCEDDASNSAQLRDSSSHTPACVRAQPGRNGAQRADGKVNSGYIDDAMEFEEGDDDVFDDAAVVESAQRPMNVSALNELPFRNCSFTSVWGSRASSTRRDDVVSASASPQRNDIRGSEESLSSVDSSDDLARRNNSLLIVEAQINNGRVEIDDKTELSSSLRRSPVIVSSRDLKVSTNNQSVPSKEASKDAKEAAARRSPLKQIKSPMKYVGDLLFKSGKSVKQEPGKGDAAPANTPAAPAAPETGVDERSSINQRTNGSVRFKTDTLEQSPDGHSAVT